MAKCPKCGKEIYELIHAYTEVVEFIFTVGEDGKPRWDFDESYPDEDMGFMCPECHEVLFKDEDEAARFLAE